MLTLALAIALATPQKAPTKLEELEKYHKPATGMAAAERASGFSQRVRMEEISPFKNISFRSVGPEIQGGRVVDIAAPEGKPATLYVAFATGGLWRTDNMGSTWTPLFEKESSFGIGAIAVHGSTVWVGSGEANSSRTSYAGTGIFRSDDEGKTWKNMGLPESHHIGRVIVNPKNPEEVYVAALGHLYTWNDERGVYKTIDGGRTWQKVLSGANPRTGAIDIAMDPGNPNVLYAALWERDRRAWNFLESGVGSALYKTTDAGKTWQRIAGLPTGQYVGRMGIAISKSNPDTVYVLLDNQEPKPEFGKNDERVPSGELTIRRVRLMTEEQLAQVDKKILERFIEGSFPPNVTVDRIVQLLKEKKITVTDIVRHVGDSNLASLDYEPIGAQVYRTDNAGSSWRLTHSVRLDGVYSSYGYYFGQIAVAPNNPERIYVLGVPIIRSDDGGRTFESLGEGIHVDHHALWLDPRWPDRVALGNDGGLHLSFDAGKSWHKLNNLPVGQFTTIALDMATPYRIYGGLQDNGTMRGPSNYSGGRTPPWAWETIGWGDGSAVQVDTRDNETVYVASQFGFGMRRDLANNDGNSVRPLADIEDEPLNYNWIAPIILSPHHFDIVYFGTNKLYRSMDQGRNWTLLSGNLAEPGNRGDVPYGTITTLTESPKKFGLIYAGTDEGRVWRTSDGGAVWANISTPAKSKWVTRVIASSFEEGTVYVSQNGYRQDDFAPYLWRSKDYGKTWTSIANGLPNEPINVIREDPKVAGLLYVGTDMGIFVSFDDGSTWEAMAGGLPHTPVHDLAIHPRDSDIVLGTHGRSVWVASVKLLQGLTPEIRSKEVYLYPVPEMTASRSWGYARPPAWSAEQPQEPEVRITFWLKRGGPAEILLKDSSGAVLKRKEVAGADNGFNFASIGLMLEPGKPIPPEGMEWKPKSAVEALQDPFENLRPKFLTPGEYMVEVHSGGASASQKFVLKAPR